MSTLALNGNGKAADLDEYFFQRRFEILLEDNNKKIASELKGMKDTINKINESISEIKRSLDGNGAVKAEPVPVAVVENRVVEDKIVRDIPKVENVKNEQAPKPRYGDYKPEDVSIDKFFYFGNKK